MSKIFELKPMVAWINLTLITVLSWIVFEGASRSKLIYLLIILTGVKALLIGYSFMDVGRANAIFLKFYPVWVVSVCLAFAMFQLF